MKFVMGVLRSGIVQGSIVSTSYWINCQIQQRICAMVNGMCMSVCVMPYLETHNLWKGLFCSKRIVLYVVRFKGQFEISEAQKLKHWPNFKH